jgi:leader peptidase (prepilin peptidase) / N-methyltransferase
VNAGALTSSGRLPAEGEHLQRARPLVSALVVGLTALAFASFDIARALVVTGLVGAIVVLAAVDLDRRVIPNRIVLPATALLLLAQLALFPGQAAEWLLAPLVVGLVLVIPALLRRHWMGMGDAKLAVLIAVGLGWDCVAALTVALLCVFPVALAMLIRHGAAARKATIPFGPFLALGALIALFAPQIAG